MDSEQSAFYDMGLAVTTFFAQHPAIPTSSTAMTAAHARFNVLMNDWEDAMQAQATDVTGPALTTDAAKRATIEAILPIADDLAALGDATGNSTLEEAASTSFTELDEAGHDAFGTKIQDLLDLANDPANAAVFTDYNVTTDDRTAATAAFATYRQKRGLGRNATAEGVAGTKAVTRIQAELRELLTDRIDKLMRGATGGDQMLLDQWKAVREIVDGPTQTRALTVTIKTIDGEPVAAADAVITPGNLMKKSGPEGIFYVQNMAPGEYQISVSKPGYLPVTGQAFVVVAGEMTSVEVVMTTGGGSGD